MGAKKHDKDLAAAWVRIRLWRDASQQSTVARVPKAEIEALAHEVERLTAENAELRAGIVKNSSPADVEPDHECG